MLSTNDVPLAHSDKRLLRLSRWYVELVSRAPGKVMLAFGVLALLALVPALQLEIHTDMVELLPEDHPAVAAIRRLAGRQKSATNVVMMVESPDAEKNRLFMEALRPRLERMIPAIFSEIQWRPDSEVPDYAWRWRWLYADEKDLLSAEQFLDRIVAQRRSPLLVDLEGDPEAELQALRKRMKESLPARVDAPRFEIKEGDLHVVAAMLWRRRDGFGTLGDHQTMAALRAAVRDLNPKLYHPRMEVRYTGHIPQALDETHAIRNDLTLATAICSTMVLLVIYLYFRRLALLWVIGAPTVLGVLLSLALARYTLHSLNVNTAFLISIILGNGINTPIVLLARYGEGRIQGRDVASSLITAMAGTMTGTLIAVSAAGIAYGSLLATSFRGFSQFGLLGGAGMLIVWMMSFLLIPPMVLWGERRWPRSLTPRPSLWKRPFQLIGSIAERHPMLLGLGAVVMLLAAVAPLSRFVKDPLEWNIENLRSETTESQRLWGRMERLGMSNVGAGYIANEGVLLVDRPEQADIVADALLKQDQARGKDHTLAVVRTLNSTLPKDQDRKLEILARLRAKIDANRDWMSAEEWRDVQEFRPPEYLRRLTIEDLPRQVLEAFTEVDGQRGRLVGIDTDPETYWGWDGHSLLRLSKSLQVKALGQTWVAASAPGVFAGMLETIMEEGPRVTALALCGVTLLLLVAFGWPGAVPVLLSLAVGVLWLGGVAGALGLKLNFMNFVALPITLGIGAEYAANIWARLRIEGHEQVRSVIEHTGSAVALCSLTTIIGYSSLLLSSNRALRSFGLLADLGEIACLGSALMALPIAIRLLPGRRNSASYVAEIG